MTVRALLLGLGNTILTDDGVGIYVVRAVAQRLEGEPIEGLELDVRQASVGGLGLLDLMAGYGVAIIVDALADERVRPGELCRVDLARGAGHEAFCLHGVGLKTALELGRSIGQALPERVEVYGVGTEDVTTFGEECTPAVRAAIPAVAGRLYRRLRALARE